MKPFKTFGGVLLSASALFLVTSCSKSMDEELAKGDRQVGQFGGGGCDPFAGLKISKNDAANTYVFFGEGGSPLETQAFNGSDFTATNLITVSALGGSPFHDANTMQIGVTDDKITAGETLAFKLSGTLASRSSLRAVFQVRGNNAVGTITLSSNGTPVASVPFSTSGFEWKVVSHSSLNGVAFNEASVSVSSGWAALTGFAPERAPGRQGPTGFYLVEQGGTSLVGRFLNGTTTISGTPYTNQWFNMETNYVLGPNTDRQNMVNPLVPNASGSGEFTPGVIPGSKNFINVKGYSGMTVTPLVFGTALQARLGVFGGAQLSTIDAGESIEFTPGPDFGKTTYRAVEIRQASTLPGSALRIKCWMNTTLVAEVVSDGLDQGYTLVTPTKDFNRVTVENAFGGGNPAIGRVSPGPSASLRFWPGCN